MAIPLERIGPYLWRIPPDARPGMRVPALVVADEALAEEMPEAYKDVREVVDAVLRFGISTRVVRLKPLGVIKG